MNSLHNIIWQLMESSDSMTTIEIPEEYESILQRAVQLGTFRSEDEALQRALELLTMELCTLTSPCSVETRQGLEKELLQGIASGPAKAFDPEQSSQIERKLASEHTNR